MRWTIVSALLVAACAGWARGQLATSEELHRLVDEGKYPDALQRITAGLALKGPAAKAVDRYELFMLKGDCHLRLRALALATKAYVSALDEATDDRQRAIATAHRALLKASKAFAYTPQPSKDKLHPAAIDILDPESRKRAFAAMLTDEIAANEPKFKAARAAKSLPPIAEAVAPLPALEGFELAATGDHVRVAALRAGLAEQSKKVVAEALRTMTARVSEIDKQANTFVEFYREVYETTPNGLTRARKEKAWKKRGVSDDQTRELGEVTATCDKLATALPELAQRLGATDEKTFDPFTEDTTRLRREADRILSGDYQRIYTELPKK